jgi:hypothetical protein
MGVRINDGMEVTTLYCSVSMWSFGPIFDSYEEAQHFLSWLDRDPREYTVDSELAAQHSKWWGLFHDADTDEFLPDADIVQGQS